MLNQSEASGFFIKNYLDYIEELPNDVQRILSKCKEIDSKQGNITLEVEKLTEQILAATSDKKLRLKSRLQLILGKLMSLKDEKIQLSQTLCTKIDTKYKNVLSSFQLNVQQVKQDDSSPVAKTSTNIQQAFTSGNAKQSTASNASSGTNSASECQEKNTKRIRKTRIDNLDIDSNDDEGSLTTTVKPPSQVVQSVPVATTKRAAASTNNKKAKKRKTTAKKQVSAQVVRETIDEVIQDDGIDPDETTYCICQQISYGEMIWCENDGCPIEWFHFSCVDLAAKPKGRWFCPQCRGDKASVMNKNLRKKQQEATSI